jgi:hypothetical protein
MLCLAARSRPRREVKSTSSNWKFTLSCARSQIARSAAPAVHRYISAKASTPEMKPDLTTAVLPDYLTGRLADYPAQQLNLATSFSNASVASFSPSTLVRYGKIICRRSRTVIPNLTTCTSHRSSRPRQVRVLLIQALVPPNLVVSPAGRLGRPSLWPARANRQFSRSRELVLCYMPYAPMGHVQDDILAERGEAAK